MRGGMEEEVELTREQVRKKKRKQANILSIEAYNKAIKEEIENKEWYFKDFVRKNIQFFEKKDGNFLVRSIKHDSGQNLLSFHFYKGKWYDFLIILHKNIYKLWGNRIIDIDIGINEATLSDIIENFQSPQSILKLSNSDTVQLSNSDTVQLLESPKLSLKNKELTDLEKQSLFPKFKGEMLKQDADTYLRGKSDGTFIVRTKSDKTILSVVYNKKPTDYLIQVPNHNDKNFFVINKKFILECDTINQMIEQLSDEGKIKDIRWPVLLKKGSSIVEEAQTYESGQYWYKKGIDNFYMKLLNKSNDNIITVIFEENPEKIVMLVTKKSEHNYDIEVLKNTKEKIVGTEDDKFEFDPPISFQGNFNALIEKLKEISFKKKNLDGFNAISTSISANDNVVLEAKSYNNGQNWGDKASEKFENQQLSFYMLQFENDPNCILIFFSNDTVIKVKKDLVKNKYVYTAYNNLLKKFFISNTFKGSFEDLIEQLKKKYQKRFNSTTGTKNKLGLEGLNAVSAINVEA